MGAELDVVAEDRGDCAASVDVTGWSDMVSAVRTVSERLRRQFGIGESFGARFRKTKGSYRFCE